jgi:hypothetical protein
VKTLDPRSRDLREHAEALHRVTRNRWGEVTLATGSTTTVVTDPTVTPDTVFIFDPMTATAAAELVAGTFYVLAADRLLGSFTITHGSSAVTDRTFRWLAAGD